MIGPPKNFNGSHDLTTLLSETVCRPYSVTCTFNMYRYIKFEVLAITNYEMHNATQNVEIDVV